MVTFAPHLACHGVQRRFLLQWVISPWHKIRVLRPVPGVLPHSATKCLDVFTLTVTHQFVFFRYQRRPVLVNFILVGVSASVPNFLRNPGRFYGLRAVPCDRAFVSSPGLLSIEKGTQSVHRLVNLLVGTITIVIHFSLRLESQWLEGR